jgi:hypothetical protein
MQLMTHWLGASPITWDARAIDEILAATAVATCAIASLTALSLRLLQAYRAIASAFCKLK